MFSQIRKLFKALNSSGKSWQLSGAVVLAMFAGFLPANSLIGLLLLFLALIFNVNFGLFLLFSVLFSGVGYLFDPLFESLGYAVLTQESLEGFFTSLYNSALFRWSAFNYTLVAGSLIVSAVLALPLFFLLNRAVALYRVQLGEKLNAWKLTRWMKLFNEEAKSTSLFRWWGVAVFAGLAGLIVFVFIFLFDPIARIGMEKGLSFALQSEVNIQEFSSNLSDLKIRVSGIEIADKDKLTHNLLEIGSTEFDLGFAALMEKKLMIEKMSVDALAFDRMRKHPAKPYGEGKALPKKEKEETKASASKSLPSFALPDVDDILAKESLKSINEAQDLKADIKTAQEKWKKISQELKSANEIDQIKADAAALQSSLKGGDISKIAGAKKEIEALKEKISTLKKKYTNLQKEFNADKESLQKRIANLKNLPSEDIERLRKKYSLNASGGANLIGTLISQEVGNYMQQVLKYYELIKPYLNDKSKPEPKEVTPPRGEGRWIKYANLSRVPEVVIKEAKINLLLREDVLDMNLRDFSSNQKLYGKPMRLDADAKGKAYKHIEAHVIDDRREAKAKTSFDIEAAEFKKESLQMSPLDMKDIVSNAFVKGEIVDKMIEAKSVLNVTKASLSMPSQKIVNDLLEGISKFNVNIFLEGEVQKPSVRVNTDLDKQLSGSLKSMASKESRAFEQKLKEGIMEKASASMQGLSADLGDAGSILGSKQDALSGINTSFVPSTSNSLKKLFKF